MALSTSARERRDRAALAAAGHDGAARHDGAATVAASWDGPDEELLDADAAAALLTVKPTTLRAWARDAAARGGGADGAGGGARRIVGLKVGRLRSGIACGVSRSVSLSCGSEPGGA